ncbi:MAG: hypothetical protein ACRYFS_05830 [Janthinobacterium lividum]
MANTNEIIEAIKQYQPEQDNWQGLDKLLEQLWKTGEPSKGIGELFDVLERFPVHDGYGVFWSIVHGLEHLPDYEPFLVNSLRRQPTEFNVLMVNRVFNAGQSNVGGVNILTLLREVLTHPKATGQAKQDAEEYIKRY